MFGESLTYILESSVKSDFTGSLIAQKYCSDIELGLKLRLDADLAYNGLLTKTPLHSSWDTFIFESEPYDLRYLSEFVDKDQIKLHKSRKRTEGETVGYKRNSELFECLRSLAYNERCKYTDYTSYYERLFALANSHNKSANPSDMLHYLEVKGIVKSIAKWTWGAVQSYHFGPA
ncbi:replication initiation protein [Pseudomonas alliivorans]|nr:replication initiation protein [Pseudomonas alliivorans]MEE4731459.1 replication initiation protein [Pseudomonas alliivorans]MEE5145849.1 replication initiation protein [Pseudomonas alliivorans]